MSCVVAPLLQLYIYGAVPPDTVKFTVPFAPELHATFAVVVAEPDNDAAGCVTVIADDTDVHPFPSVMVTVYVPADIFAKFCVLAPLLQLYIYGSVPPAGGYSIAPVVCIWCGTACNRYIYRSVTAAKTRYISSGTCIA